MTALVDHLPLTEHVGFTHYCTLRRDISSYAPFLFSRESAVSVSARRSIHQRIEYPDAKKGSARNKRTDKVESKSADTNSGMYVLPGSSLN